MCATPRVQSAHFRPWLTIWFHPRQTIQAIVDVNPLHRIYLLVLLSGLSSGIDAWLMAVMRDSDTWQENALLAIGYGLVPGTALRLAHCLVLQWITGRSGDRVPYAHLVAANFWGTVPTVGFLLVFIVIFVGETLALILLPTTAAIGTSLDLLLMLASLLSQIWSATLIIGALAQVMRCPVTTVLGRGIVAALILAVPSWALTRLFSYLGASYSGGDIIYRGGDVQAGTNLASILASCGPSPTVTPLARPFIVFASGVQGRAELYAVNTDGTGKTRLTNDPNDYWEFICSPDGRRIAFVSGLFTDNAEIYVMNADGSGQTRLTDAPGKDNGPIWSPDGQRIAFTSERDGNVEIYVMNADGTGQTRLTDAPGKDNGPTWSPDGQRIAFTSERDGNREIYVMNNDGSVLTNLTNNPAEDTQPAWSPDGTRILFVSHYELYTMNADGTGQTRLTQDQGCHNPAWSPDGSRIVFSSIHTGYSEIFVINADGTSLTNLTSNPSDPTHDNSPAWSPDGQRIAFNTARSRDWAGGDAGANDEIYVMNADGRGQINVTNSPGYEGRMTWCP